MRNTRAVRVVEAPVANIIAGGLGRFVIAGGNKMQWLFETIASPATGSLDADLDQGSATDGNDANSFAHDLLHTLQAIRGGDFSVRMAGNHGGVAGEIAETLNSITAANQGMVHQLRRVGEDV